MAMNLKRRLRALEQVVTPTDDRCRRCGYDGRSPLQIKMSFGDEPEGHDVCPECRRRMILRLSFDESAS